MLKPYWGVTDAAGEGESVMKRPTPRVMSPTEPKGRRVQSIGSSLGGGDDRPNARDHLASVETASGLARASWIAFLGVMTYLAVTLGGMTHVDLLLNNETTLPFVTVRVPLTTFFIMAPLAFVLVHFGLLLQHVILSRKLRAFEERLQNEWPRRGRADQHIRDELHSYSFTQATSGKPKGAAVEIALGVMMSLTLAVLPLLLLGFFQIGFLPFHSEAITYWHQAILLADIAIFCVLSRHLARRDRGTNARLTDWWHGKSRAKAEVFLWWRLKFRRATWAMRSFRLSGHRNRYWPSIAQVADPLLGCADWSGRFLIWFMSPTRMVMGAVVFFSLFVATLPDSHIDMWAARKTTLSVPVPYCWQAATRTPEGACANDNRLARRAFRWTAYLFEREVNEKTGKSDSFLGWSRNLVVTDKDLTQDKEKFVRLNLRGRDLRYAIFDRSGLKGADLFGAELRGGRLVGTNLNAANLSGANLQDADLSMVSLQGANLYEARLQRANITFAVMHGANLVQVKMQGTDLLGASLQGADLSGASLQGADLTQSNLSGASLLGANLSGAILLKAKLEGSDLREVTFQGADLSSANMQGADLSFRTPSLRIDSPVGIYGPDPQGARLEGANLLNARLQGANLLRAKLQGANMSQAIIWNTGAPGAWEFGSFFRLRIQALDDAERLALGETISELKGLHEKIGSSNAVASERMFDAAKTVAARLRPLLEEKIKTDWKTRAHLRTWCDMRRQPPPDSAKLGNYLGELACSDETDQGYLARELIKRVLQHQADAFLEAFNGCPAFKRIPVNSKRNLEQAAQRDRKQRERTRIAENLSQRACNDATETAIFARWHALQSLRSQPAIFLESFKRCSVFARVAGDLRSWLLVSAVQMRRGNLSLIGESAEPERLDICASL